MIIVIFLVTVMVIVMMRAGNTWHGLQDDDDDDDGEGDASDAGDFDDDDDGRMQHLAWLVGAVSLAPHREAATLDKSLSTFLGGCINKYQ